MRRFILLFLAGAVLGLIALIALPHNHYYRFQEHRLLNTRKADWIYERLNFDDTPIDVAFIGTSRTAGGISGPLIEELYCKAHGRRIHVANLAMPQSGRDMDYLLAKKLFAQKDPALLYLQISEIESRKPHPGFLQLADASDILTAPILINFNWVKNIMSLPGRQLSLATKTWRDQPALRSNFDPEAYIGPDMDRTLGINLIDGTFKSRASTQPKEDLDRAYKRRKRQFTKTFLLPGPLRSLEYRMPRVYLERVFDLAAKDQSDVEFIYLPAYRFDGPVPDHIAQLTGGHPIRYPAAALVPDHSKWLNPNHTNTDGSLLVTRVMAETLIDTHPDLGRADSTCPGA